jgi:hypothetical protein
VETTPSVETERAPAILHSDARLPLRPPLCFCTNHPCPYPSGLMNRSGKGNESFPPVAAASGSRIAAALAPVPPPALGSPPAAGPGNRRPTHPPIRLTTPQPRGVAAMESSSRAFLAGRPPLPYCAGPSSPSTRSPAAAGWPSSPRRAAVPAQRRQGRAQFKPGMCRKGGVLLSTTVCIEYSSPKLSAAACLCLVL